MGNTPLHISASALVQRFGLWVLRLEEHQHILNVDNLDFNRDIRVIPANQKFLAVAQEDFQADFEIYTDGSRADGNVGSRHVFSMKTICFQSPVSN
uniref:RNase H type-1 domain-containing protein n=1 Tax=Araneus ventricosus TaxID=182803 RepID=A0A4Y2HCC8_ARAVE|nr:hypothetical protein AVEN_46654-1 [Araneus ventricosus]